MDSKLFEKMISEGFEEAKETEERLKQRILYSTCIAQFNFLVLKFREILLTN